MKTEKINEVTLWVHWKQGDDLAYHLKENEVNAVQALRDWADDMEAGARAVRELAGALEGRRAEIHADTHHIGIDAGPETVEKIRGLDGVHVEEVEVDPETRERLD